MKKCTGTDYDKEHCQVEKMGCEGCDHWKEETKTNGVDAPKGRER